MAAQWRSVTATESGDRCWVSGRQEARFGSGGALVLAGEKELPGRGPWAFPVGQLPLP